LILRWGRGYQNLKKKPPGRVHEATGKVSSAIFKRRAQRRQGELGAKNIGGRYSTGEKKVATRVCILPGLVKSKARSNSRESGRLRAWGRIVRGGPALNSDQRGTKTKETRVTAMTESRWVLRKKKGS